jgi:hypothetical protein
VVYYLPNLCIYSNRAVLLNFRCRFIRVEELKEQLLENNKQTYWVPDYVKVRTVSLYLFLFCWLCSSFHYEIKLEAEMVCLVR